MKLGEKRDMLHIIKWVEEERERERAKLNGRRIDCGSTRHVDGWDGEEEVRKQQ